MNQAHDPIAAAISNRLGWFGRVLNRQRARSIHENELGFKMVKWVAAIELVHDFADLGAGQGGYNEDHEFYGYRIAI